MYDIYRKGEVMGVIGISASPIKPNDILTSLGFKLQHDTMGQKWISGPNKFKFVPQKNTHPLAKPFCVGKMSSCDELYKLDFIYLLEIQGGVCKLELLVSQKI